MGRTHNGFDTDFDTAFDAGFGMIEKDAPGWARDYLNSPRRTGEFRTQLSQLWL